MTTVTFTLRMTKAQKRALRMAAAAADQNMSDFAMAKLQPDLDPYLPASNDPQTDQKDSTKDRSNSTREAVALVY